MSGALDQFSLADRVAVVTGGSGVLGRVMAQGLASVGARVAIIGRRLEPCEIVADEIRAQGGQALAVAADVLDRDALTNAAQQIFAALGSVDILVNGAGGNQPKATATPDLPWFDLDRDAVDAVWQGNFMSALACCQVFGHAMAERGEGTIINVASMSAIRPLSRVGVYGAAKAALVNFTQWLAVTIARETSPHIRVNALAPGFFLTEQNRYLLTEPQTGGWTPRGESIIAHTPMARMGVPEDLVGTLLWLASPASQFVTGVVVPVDGGFAVNSGV